MPRVEASIRIENVVGTATLNQRIDLNAVVKRNPGVEYHPEQFPGLVFKMARELVERFSEKFTTDFENNKKLESLTNISSKKLRNKVAGYITQIQNQKKQNKLTTEQKEIIS